MSKSANSKFDFTVYRKEAMIMFAPDPVRPFQADIPAKSGNSFNDVALAMFPSMIDQLLAPQSTPLELPEFPVLPDRDADRESFPQR